MSVLTQSNLLPFRQYAEAEVVNLFSLDGTGLAGQFVSIPTGANDPADSAGSYGSISVGASYANATSLRHLVTRKVEPTDATDDKYSTLGVTLHTTAEYDENGNRLINMPSDMTYERGFVVSGQAVPVLKRGLITIKKSQVTNTAYPGYVGVPAAAGGITALNPTDLAGIGTGTKVLGKFISTSGSAFGGYYQFLVGL
jgi:hypothetical protein